MAILYKQDVACPIGTLTLLSSDLGLCYIKLPGEDNSHMKKFIGRYFPDTEIRPGGALNKKAAAEIQAYFAGKLKKFTVKLDLRSEGFYRKVQQEVAAIPFGQTTTYGQIAATLGKPKASRAVGGGNGSNPIPIIIPCHRVLSTTGLGGYGGGLQAKRWLLRHEGIEIR